jgi:hypothetical protein
VTLTGLLESANSLWTSLLRRGATSRSGSVRPARDRHRLASARPARPTLGRQTRARSSSMPPSRPTRPAPPSEPIRAHASVCPSPGRGASRANKPYRAPANCQTGQAWRHCRDGGRQELPTAQRQARWTDVHQDQTHSTRLLRSLDLDTKGRRRCDPGTPPRPTDRVAATGTCLLR